ncbi:isochorismatase family protein [Streptomyces sp. NPDC096132]|uniref:isochorismatase family protein n=1 Tax=Streptomyces sp. NPDC096132 TaxID=3366075 RepID=UPI0038082335
MRNFLSRRSAIAAGLGLSASLAAPTVAQAAPKKHSDHRSGQPESNSDAAYPDAYTPENAAMLLIDHQVGTMSWTHSHDIEEVKKAALNLAKIATATEMPLVLTSSMEGNIQGPLLPELEEIAPQAFADRIKRAGIVNAMHDENFANAVRATGRKRIIIAGITTEVCVVFPVLQLLGEGYDVQVVTDASASFTKIGDDAALRRMEQAGAAISSTAQVVSELAVDWTTPRGQALAALLGLA